MKIFILGPAYPLRGGIAHFNALLAKHLGVRHKVEVITFKRQYPSLLFPGVSQRETGSPGIDIAGEQRIDSINPFNWFRVGANLRARKPDVIVLAYWQPFFGPCLGAICRLVKHGTTTKVVAVCHNIIPHERYPLDTALTRYAFGAVDAFIVQSESVERDLLALVARPRYKRVAHPVYEIFGSAISKEQARRALNIADERTLLMFGYIRQYKGLSVLIEAMKLVRQSLPVRALVVGEFYEDAAPYREQVKQAGVEDAVQLLGQYVPNTEVANYFCAADAVVLPYLSATQSGITQIAYNFGKPVITTNVGGLAEVVVDGVSGLVVPPNDPRSLAEAIIKFYSQELEQKLASGAQQQKQKYSWQAMVNAIEDLVK